MKRRIILISIAIVVYINFMYQTKHWHPISVHPVATIPAEPSR